MPAPRVWGGGFHLWPRELWGLTVQSLGALGELKVGIGLLFLGSDLL